MAWVPAAAQAAAAAAQAASSYFGKDKTKKVRTMPKEAERYFKDIYTGQSGIQNNPLYQQGANYLRDIYSNEPNAMANFERPYREQFEQQTVPGIAQRFAGMGTGAGGLNSSALQQQLAQAGRGLQGDLATMREKLRMQALGQGYQYAMGPEQMRFQAAQQRPYESIYQPNQGGQGSGSAFFNSAQDAWKQYQGSGGDGGGGSGGDYQPQQPLTAGYDQEFRQNPAAMGY